MSKGGPIMERTIGDRIKELRQKANLTQAQLAEKLGFTSQTVSNWESGTREPDIAALAQLSSLFNVSLDYLLLGKQEETITLDDMDAEKRLSLLIKKDDVKNFKKYEYQTSAYVFGRSVNYGNHYNITLSEPNKKTWLEIINAGAKKIFSACCDELIKKNTQKVWTAFLVYDFIDEFVKMAIDCDKPEALETIGFRIFAVGDRPNNRGEIPFSYQREVGWYINRVETYFIKPETFEYIFQNREKSPKCFEYATSFELQIVPLNNYNSQRKEYTFTHLHNNIVEMAIKYKAFEVLDKLLSVYREELNSENLPKREYNGYNASYSTDWTNTYVTGNNRVYGRIFYFRESDIKSLLESGETKYAKKLNDYNAEVIERIKSLNYTHSRDFAKVVHLNDAEIDRLTKLNSKLSDEERAKLECINNYILVTNKVNALRDLKLARKIIDSGYYHYYEFVYDCLTKGNQKVLLKFFIDNDFENLADKLARGKSVYSELLGEAWCIFNANEGDPEHKRLIALSNRIENRHEMIELNGERFMANDEAQKLTDNRLIKYFKSQKEALYENVKRAVEAEKKAKEEAAERAKIVKGLTKEHFEELLSKKDSGSRKLFIIDLCSLFDAILRFDYHIEGEDFSARMNKYFAQMNENAPQSRTMDDGWGYQVPDTKYDEEVVIPEQERINHLSDIFNRLRIERNNIAHSERKPVKELSESELNECLNHIFR